MSGSGPTVLGWHAGGGLSWLEWRGAGAAAAFPTREGGVSPAPFDTLNLGLVVPDLREHVLVNRERWASALGHDASRLVVPHQVHGLALREVDRRHAGRGALRQEDALSGTDALLTATPDLPLAISTADCVPVVISGRGEEAGALLATVHAGWRGMLGGIVARAVAMMRQRGAARAAVVGPSIGPCCFTVDDALERRFEARFPGSGRGGAVDLWHCARLELAAAGLPPDAIVAAGVCTSCDRRFFSHRRDQGSTGRHLALAWLEPA